jgi:hypothetical protein
VGGIQMVGGQNFSATSSSKVRDKKMRKFLHILDLRYRMRASFRVFRSGLQQKIIATANFLATQDTLFAYKEYQVSQRVSEKGSFEERRLNGPSSSSMLLGPFILCFALGN